MEHHFGAALFDQHIVILFSGFKSVIMLTGRENCCDDFKVFCIASVSLHGQLVYFETSKLYYVFISTAKSEGVFLKGKGGDSGW